MCLCLYKIVFRRQIRRWNKKYTHEERVAIFGLARMMRGDVRPD
jgi:hypothetical protein